MPKQVDDYVLEREIGSGQFGKVYKGYNKVNLRDVAVKAIRRDLLTDKLLELLDNEIKVLSACDNINITKLYDIKKTANNYYLIIEFCNEGDLSDYLKKKKYLTEDEAVDFFLQILNAFRTLVKNKIMHRDFKLANIMKHDDLIKVADFGFSKLLGKDGMTDTILGSPINMAPEVLGGSKYNNKADIWSIGTVFYELLFGRPPFTARSLVELMKNIKSKTLDIPRKINNISPVCEDILRRMLVVDPEDRISWDELFKHKINFYREEKIKKELEESLIIKDTNIMLSMSRFYINNNKVIQNLQDFSKKQEINDFALDIAQGKREVSRYDGPIFKLKENSQEEIKKEKSPKSTDIKQEESDNNPIPKEESDREAKIRIIKRNSARILHERNKYLFLASVAEDCMTTGLEMSEYAAFILVKRLLQMINQLKDKILTYQNIFSLDEWLYYIKTSEFKAISKYILGENDVFEVYFNCMYDMVASIGPSQNKTGINSIDIVNKNFKTNMDKAFNITIFNYVLELVKFIQSGGCQNDDEKQRYWLHADQLMDCLRLDKVFTFEDSGKKQFDFMQFYEEVKLLSAEKLKRKVLEKMVALE